MATAHPLITVEPVHDPARPNVHYAVVERNGPHRCELCTDLEIGSIDVLPDVARAYAIALGDDYQPSLELTR